MPDTGDAKKRVLLADDSKLMRVSAKKVLSEEFDVVFAADGDEAWGKLINDEGITVVFTDLTMPELDGFGLLERIRTSDDDRINGLPVIVLTAGENEATREKAYEQGATDFLTKPFDSVNLRARAHSHVNSQVQSNRLHQETVMDPQTGLYNRRYFIERLNKDRSAAARHDLDLTLLYLELANFRGLFLKNGKDIAYEVLGRVGEIIRDEVRTEDTPARVGVAEFALSLPLTSPEGGERLAERLKEAIASEPFELRTEAIPVMANTGLLQVPSDREISPENLIQEVAKKIA